MPTRTRPTILTLAALTSLTAASQAHATFTSFSSVGANAAAITPTRDAFREAVGGGSVAGSNGSFGGVRREINWDGLSDSVADPNVLTGNVFASRGVILATPGTALQVSSTTGPAPILFGFPSDFAPFSGQRIFTAINSNVTDITFVVPGTDTPTTTSAFGAVFVDVEIAGLSKLEFFNTNNTLIFSQFVDAGANQGFSFLGAVANNGEAIAHVRITAGLNTITANGTLGNPNDDVVALDDFIYAEPTAIPEPAVMSLIPTALLPLMRRRRNA